MEVVRALLLILMINGTPKVLSHILSRGSYPLDGNLRLKDKRPLLGTHKTARGVAGGILAGGFGGLVLGFPFFVGLLAGALGMAGDAFSSFVKRRMLLREGAERPFLDLVPEAALPLFWLWITGFIALWELTAALALFVACGRGLDFLERKLFRKPECPVQLVRSASRFRQWRACHTALSPLARVLNFENVLYYHYFMKGVFRLAGVYERGALNALEVALRRIDIRCPGLPRAFHSYRILFLSDLHIDGQEGLTERLIRLVSPIQADLCLFGGDYRMEMYGPFFVVRSRMQRLVQEIRARDGIFGVLGNHDCLEVAPDLEDAGICMLVNESVPVERDGDRIWIAGVDDPHYYKCHNLEKAFEDIPRGEFTILLSHSPEVVRDFGPYPINLCLCGHTHGGQIRLPRLGPLFTHVNVARRFVSGLWKEGPVIGYTTAGAGSSGVPVRFHCPPEVTLITLLPEAQ